MKFMERIAAGAHWYRRLSILSLVMTGVLVAIFAISINENAMLDNMLRITLPVGILATLTAAVAALALWRGWMQETAGGWDVAAYALLTLTVGWLIYDTGGLASPYLPLWLIVASFGGLFGVFGLGALAVVSNFYIFWEMVIPTSVHPLERFLLAFLAADLPLIVSYITWHKRPTPEVIASRATQALRAELTAAASQSEIVVNSIADGVIAIDQHGSIRLINPAAQALLGWHGNDAMNLHYELVLKLTDDREQALTAGNNPIEQVRVTKQPIVNNTLTLITSAERKLLVSMVVSPILGKQNEVQAVIVVLRDITNEKAQERAQAEFVSTASHEMRTPVAAIEGYLGLALNTTTATVDERARGYLLKAQDSVQHLGRLFQDLLSVSRADDNRLQQHPQVTDIVGFARDITDSLMQKARDKGLELEFVPDGNASDANRKLAPIFYGNVDRDHLREVLANLIENAIKYTPSGHVRVDVLADDRQIKVSVADSGIGIPAEDVPHLFQKFYRVDNSATREIGGTGLGLYLCRRLIESMGGKIWLESEFGHGSVFNIAFQRLSNLDIKAIKDAETISSLSTQLAAAPVASVPAPTLAPPAPLQPAAAQPQPISDVLPAAPPAPASLAVPPRQINI